MRSGPAQVAAPSGVSRHAGAALLGLAAALLFVAYETTMPFSFHFTRAQLAQAWGRASLIPFNAAYERGGGPSDYIGNVVLFVPLGFFLALSPLLVRRSGRSWLLVLAGCLLSAFIETIQLFAPSRFTQTSDVITNAIGTFLGVRLACAGGNALFDRGVGALLRRVREGPLALLAVALTGAILFGSLLPLDVSISRASLTRHLQEIDFHLLTSGGPAGVRLEAATGLLKRAWLFLFWGLVMGQWLARSLSPGRAFLRTLAGGAALALVAEAGQIVIVSRTLDPFAPLAGLLGAAAGAAAALWGSRLGLGGRRLLVLSLVLYGSYLVLDLIGPLDPAVVSWLRHGGPAPAEALRFDWAPFRQSGDDTRMMVLGAWAARIVRFGPLGALLIVGIGRATRRWLAAVAAAAVVFGCELVHAWLGPDGGSLTAVLMSLAGVALGAVVAARLLPYLREPGAQVARRGDPAAPGLASRGARDRARPGSLLTGHEEAP